MISTLWMVSSAMSDYPGSIRRVLPFMERKPQACSSAHATPIVPAERPASFQHVILDEVLPQQGRHGRPEQVITLQLRIILRGILDHRPRLIGPGRIQDKDVISQIHFEVRI